MSWQPATLLRLKVYELLSLGVGVGWRCLLVLTKELLYSWEVTAVNGLPKPDAATDLCLSLMQALLK